MVAAHCVSFSGDSSKLLAGYENVVRVFDPQVPGRKYTVRKTLGTLTNYAKFVALNVYAVRSCLIIFAL